MSIIDETIESVRSRGFLDNPPGTMAKDAPTIQAFCVLMSRVGKIARGMFHDDPSIVKESLRWIDLDACAMETALAELEEGREVEDGEYDPYVMYQVFKWVEESGEFLSDLAMQRPSASVELADVFVTVCSMAAAFGRDNGYSLEDEVRGKLGDDEERGHLHGAEPEVGCHQ